MTMMIENILQIKYIVELKKYIYLFVFVNFITNLIEFEWWLHENIM